MQIEITELEQLHSDYSDLYKDVHGIRPRWAKFSTVEEAEAAYNQLAAYAEQVFAEEEVQEQLRVKQFEVTVAKLIKVGANTRETAIRWLADANDVGNDYHFLCWSLGLPYNYFNNLQHQSA